MKGLAQEHRLSAAEKTLLALFLLTLPLVNPWVRGDGVGYYAYVRAMVVQHNLDFTQDWLHANSSFVMGRVDAQGRIQPDQYTATGHLDNHFSVGPAILWSPFIIAAHWMVKLADMLGAHILADGFSRPYIWAMAIATALYGFLGIWLSFRLARKYVQERWALWGTLGVWFASSFPVYMYFNPSWSHTHSAFAVAFFLWYWERTRVNRTTGQAAFLGLLAGLMVNVYYPNGVILLVPLAESVGKYWHAIAAPKHRFDAAGGLLLRSTVFAGTALLALLPTFVTRRIVYGSPFELGYVEAWYWNSPALGNVLFSADHGLFAWTPILLLALGGLLLLRRKERDLALAFFLAFAGFSYFVGCYSNWHGIASFGNRFFVSLTAIFAVGLACALESFALLWKNARVGAACARAFTLLFIVWNLGFIFQWGMHLVPSRGPISWREMAHNQIAVVPGQVSAAVTDYLFRRRWLMRRIEEVDVKQLKQSEARQNR